MTVSPLVALLDQVADDDASLIRRLCALTAFTQTVDELFADPPTRTRARIRPLVARQTAVVRQQLYPALAGHGMGVVRWDQLSTSVRRQLAEVFRRRIHPALTPLAVDSTHPFPQPASLSLNLAVTVLDRRRDTQRFLTVTVPRSVPRLLTVGAGQFLPVEDLVSAHLGDVLPGSEILTAGCFRVTRARGRGFTCARRLELESATDEWTESALRQGLAVDEFATYRLDSTELIGPAFASLIPLVREPARPRELRAISSERRTSAARAATATDPRSGAQRRLPHGPLPAPAAIAARAG